MKNIKEIKLNNYSIIAHLEDLEFIDGYFQIMSVKEKDEEHYEVTTGVIDEEFNVVVPLRKEVVLKNDFNNYEYNNDVSLYSNKKIIYRLGKNEFYLIDLQDTCFELENNKYVPKKYLKKFSAYYGIDDEKIIMYFKDSACIYNVLENKPVSNMYDFIEKHEEYEDVYLAYCYSINKYSNPFLVQLEINSNFGIYQEAMVNEAFLTILPSSVLGDKNKIIKYCDDCYNYYIEDYSKEYNSKGMIH